MSLEEIFIVTFTLKAYNMDYDIYDNPKIAMVDILKKKGVSKCFNFVYDNILDLPSIYEINNIIKFLFDNFKINCTDKDKIAFFYNMPLDKCINLFKNDIRFAELLLNNYFDTSINYYIGNTNLCSNVSNIECISINNKLKNDFNNIFDDFHEKSMDVYQTFDLYYLILFENRHFKNEEKLTCYESIENLRNYRKYFIRLMASELYENYMFSNSETGKLYNGVLEESYNEFENLDNDEEYDEEEDNSFDGFYEDPTYLIDDNIIIEFKDVIEDIANNNNEIDYSVLPREFYEDLLEHYYWLSQDDEVRRHNREYMKKNHQKVLKRINPFYMFDDM